MLNSYKITGSPESSGQQALAEERFHSEKSGVWLFSCGVLRQRLSSTAFRMWRVSNSGTMIMVDTVEKGTIGRAGPRSLEKNRRG